MVATVQYSVDRDVYYAFIFTGYAPVLSHKFHLAILAMLIVSDLCLGINYCLVVTWARARDCLICMPEARAQGLRVSGK